MYGCHEQSRSVISILKISSESPDRITQVSSGFRCPSSFKLKLTDRISYFYFFYFKSEFEFVCCSFFIVSQESWLPFCLEVFITIGGREKACGFQFDVLCWNEIHVWCCCEWDGDSDLWRRMNNNDSSSFFVVKYKYMGYYVYQTKQMYNILYMCKYMSCIYT